MYPPQLHFSSASPEITSVSPEITSVLVTSLPFYLKILYAFVSNFIFVLRILRIWYKRNHTICIFCDLIFIIVCESYSRWFEDVFHSFLFLYTRSQQTSFCKESVNILGFSNHKVSCQNYSALPWSCESSIRWNINEWV